MLGNRVRGLWNVYHCILAVVLTGLYWIFLIAISPIIQGRSVANYQPFILYNLAAIVGLIIAAIRNRSNAATLLAGGFLNYHTLALKQTVSIGVVLLLTLALGMEAEFRHMRIALLFAFLGSVYLVFLICHFLIPQRLADQLFADEHEQRTLLIGPVEKAREVNKWIIETRAFGFGLRGSPTESDTEEGRILHVAGFSSESVLERLIRDEGIRQVLLLELPRDRDVIDRIVATVRKAGVRLLVLDDLPEIFRHNISIYSLHNETFISLMDEPLEDPVNRILKRTTDILVTLPMVIFVLPPLCIFVKIVQAIESPGPLFHRETRSGFNNLPFRIFNFRTTPTSTPHSPKSNDADRYPIGLWLRRHSIDRFPEFLNVFLGGMSVVGPRPHRPMQNRRFSQVVEGYHCRTFAKPGITGLAQMSGYRGEVRNDEDVVERAKLDLKYIESWSLPLDFWIIFNTIPQLFIPPKTAY